MEREFHPMAPYRRLYESDGRKMPFPTTGVGEFERWRRALRAKVVETLGGFPATRVPLDAEIVSVRQFDGYRRERVVFNSAPNVSVPGYLLVPDGLAGRAPAVLAVHGHGYGKDDIVGLWEDGTERSDPDGYHKDFALSLVRAGFVTLAIEQACFGERREERELRQEAHVNSCTQASFFATMLGKTVLGTRVWDIIRAVDYLETRPEVTAGRIGCMGISGGGATALFSAALEDRICAVVVSGYLNTFRDSILAVPHCACNFVPGLLQYAEMFDIAALIAPRPLLVESGTKDPIFPIEATRYALAQLQPAYDLLGAGDRLEADIFEGRHQISGREAYRWLRRRLDAR